MHTSTRNSIAGKTHPLASALPLLGLAAAFCTQPLAAQAPAVVATSQLTLNGSFTSGPAVFDACGNLYVFESGTNTGVVEYQAGTGQVTTIIANAQGYVPLPDRAALYMDQAKKNLYFPDFTNYYTAHFDQVPIVNCVPGAINNNFGGNTGSLPSPNYYYGSANDITGDAAGDVFFTATQSSQSTIFGEIYNAVTSTYAVTTPLPTWPNFINYVAADAAGDIYFADQTSSYTFSTPNPGQPPTLNVYAISKNIYVLKAPYNAAPVLVASGFNDIGGLSFDNAGNLYIIDQNPAQPTPPTTLTTGTVPVGNPVLYEIPNTANGLNGSNLFAIANINATYKIAVSAEHNIYLSNGSGLIELQTNSALAPATAIGSTAGTVGINYVFNTTVTPTSITAVTGPATSAIFSPGTIPPGTGACVTGTAYTAISATSVLTSSTCTLTATFTPSAAGLETGAILFTNSSGTVTTDIAGVGLSPQLTIDPGTVTALTTVLKAPSGITVDNRGNVFVTDSSTNTLTEFASGSKGIGTTISTGSITLNSPNGVAVDNIGDIFIADSGNNRVVEIPVVKGVLTNASTFALSPTLRNPQGVAVDGQGNLYIADTGDNNLLFVPNISGTLTFTSATANGTTLNGPSAVTVDLNGNVFVAETGNSDVLEFLAPFGTSGQIKVASGVGTPTGLVTDASGSLYVVANGSSSILRFPKVNGAFGSQTLVGSTIASPFAVAADPFGNLYATDTVNDVVAEIQRVQTALQFGGWNVGTTSTPFTGTLSDSGTQSLIFQSPSYTASGNLTAGFKVTSDGCAGQTLQTGSSCAVTSTFTPPTTELNATETLTINANDSNGTGQLQLVGTGANVTPSTLALVLTGPTPLNAGQSVTLVATVGTGSNTATPGGTVKFSINGVQVGSGNVSNKQVTLVLKNGLPAGNVTISASYSGDVINYSGSTASITQTVIALPDTLTLVASTPYTNPQSIGGDSSLNLAGPAIPLTATLTPSGSIIPNGIITFYSGSTVLGISSLTALSPTTYTGSIATTSLRAGTTNLVENDSFLTTYSNIYAVYSTDTSYAAATSNTTSVSVLGVNPTANLANPNLTGAAFAVTPTNPIVTVVSSGVSGIASGSTTLSFISYGGYQGIVNFTCTGLPAYAQCAPFPGDPLIEASVPGLPEPFTTISFIINTNVPPLVPTASSTIWWVSAILGLCLLFLRRRITRLRSVRLLALAAAVLLSLGSILGTSACSSSTSTSTYRTPTGTSVVTVTLHAAQTLSSGTATPSNNTNTGGSDVNTPVLQLTLVVQ